MKSVYVLGWTHWCLHMQFIGLIYLLKICTCVPSFRFDFFPTNFLSMANTVNKLIEIFDERNWTTPQQHWFPLTLTMSVMNLENSSCQISWYVPFIALKPLIQFTSVVQMKLLCCFINVFTDHNHPARKDIRTVSNQRSCLK